MTFVPSFVPFWTGLKTFAVVDLQKPKSHIYIYIGATIRHNRSRGFKPDQAGQSNQGWRDNECPLGALNSDPIQKALVPLNQCAEKIPFLRDQHAQTMHGTGI